MTTTVPSAGSTPAPKNLLARFIGIVTAPKETFQSIVATPRVLGMLVVVTVLMAISAALPVTTQGGRQAAIDKAEEGMRAVQKMGINVDMEKMHEQMEKSASQMPVRNAITFLLLVPIVTVISAGIFFAIFNAGLGGEARFKQVYAVIIHAGVISTLQMVFSAGINYMRETVDAGTNLGMLFPFLPEQSFVVSFFSAIDIFRVWWVVVLSIGLAVLYRRRTAPIAYTLFGIYALFAIGYAVFKSVSGGA
jgi:Yip1 domain